MGRGDVDSPSPLSFQSPFLLDREISRLGKGMGRPSERREEEEVGACPHRLTIPSSQRERERDRWRDLEREGTEERWNPPLLSFNLPQMPLLEGRPYKEGTLFGDGADLPPTPPCLS